MNTADSLRQSLKQALLTCDWLQAIASAREILEMEPEALDERHLLAQLYLRVSGSRLASVQFHKVLQQALRRRELWKAVAAQKSLDNLSGVPAVPATYARIFTQVVRPEGPRGPGHESFPPVLEKMAPEVFGKMCLDMRQTSMIQNERWTVPAGGPSLLVAAWGQVWLEREEESIEAAEGEILFLAPPADEHAVELVAMEETTLLHLEPGELSGFAAQVPGLESLASPPERPVRAPGAVAAGAGAGAGQGPSGDVPAAAGVSGPARSADPAGARPDTRDDVLLSARLVVHPAGEQGNVTLPGLVSGLSETGATFECESSLLPVDPATLSGLPVALQVSLRTREHPYRWIGRLDWVTPAPAGGPQGFRCGVCWDGLSEEDRAAVGSLRGVRGSETNRLFELWNSYQGTER